MAFCGKCGTKVDEGVNFCPGCGNPMTAAPAPEPVQGQPTAPVSEPTAANQDGVMSKITNLNNTADLTDTLDEKDISQNKVMGILAYIGPLCFIPMFAAKDSKFARFHANQGLVLLIAEVALSVALWILNAILLAISWRLYFLTVLLNLLNFVPVLFVVLGIINAAKGKAKELPVIGKVKILK